jgi:quercetin 2,3-dioxygenase
VITLRRAKDRGQVQEGWLKSFHTFSFGTYHDPEHHGFRQLRVINEDWVQPGKGFGMHEHRDMEILTYVLEGSLAHKDSLGNGSTIRRGEVQRMSAGTGIFHSELNPSNTEAVHLLQIWIRPALKSQPPSYEQLPLDARAQTGEWLLLASPHPPAGSLTLGQDALVWALHLPAGHETRLPLPEGRYGWLQVVSGELDLAGHVLSEGDGAAIEDAPSLDLHAKTESEVLFFDLA